MTGPIRPPNRFFRFHRWLGGTRSLSWLHARLLHRLDGALLRLSGGRWILSGLLTGLPMITLTTTGARSGQPRSVPLVALRDGDTIVLMASNWGQAHHPAWYHNLRAHPEATIARRGRSATYVAREATAAERARYWPLADATYPGYAAYRRRATGRTLPIMLLTPKGERR